MLVVVVAENTDGSGERRVGFRGMHWRDLVPWREFVMTDTAFGVALEGFLFELEATKAEGMLQVEMLSRAEVTALAVR